MLRKIMIRATEQECLRAKWEALDIIWRDMVKTQVIFSEITNGSREW